jgi:uncharacterized membrane protein YczE
MAARQVTRSRLTVRLVALYAGLMLYGLSGALQVRARLGLDPWDVLHQGLAGHLGLEIGTVLIIVGAVVLLFWIPLRQRPGLGTVSNVVLVGLGMNAALAVLPSPHRLGSRIAEVAGGILLCAVATALYLGAAFGAGPRDGLMTGLAARTGYSIRAVRTVLELTVLGVGWLLGGTVGFGTVAFAVAIGPLTQIFLPLLDTSGTRTVSPRRPRRRGPARWPAGRRRSRTPGSRRRTPAAERPAIPG